MENNPKRRQKNQFPKKCMGVSRTDQISMGAETIRPRQFTEVLETLRVYRSKSSQNCELTVYHGIKADIP